MLSGNTDTVAADTIEPTDSVARQEKVTRDPDALRLERARALDRSTLGGIYDEFQPLLYRYVYRRVGDVEVARDLTADVFRRFLQATANGNGPDKQLRAWLFRVAHNIVIDHYRRRDSHQALPLEESLVSGEADPGSQAEQLLLCNAVRLALARLTADQQEVIVLKFLEGLANEEVARITNKSVGAVKALQHRALAALRRQLILPEEGQAA